MGQSCPCSSEDPGKTLESTSKSRHNKDTEKFLAETSAESSSDNGEDLSDGTEAIGEASNSHTQMINVNGDDVSKKEEIYKSWREALLDGNTALLDYYTQEHPELRLVNYQFPDGSSSLSKAIQCKLYGVVHNLISEGADVHHINEQSGNTPLHEAVLVENLQLVTFLVKQKEVDTMIQNNDSKTPYDLAKDMNNHDIAELLEPEPVVVVTQSTEPKSALQELSEIVGEGSIDVMKANEKDSKTANTNKQAQQNHDVLPSHSGTNGSQGKQGNADIKSQLQGDSEPAKKSDTKEFALNRGYYEQLQKNVKPKIGADNPFNRKLKRKSTRLALHQMEKIQQAQSALPVLEAFLQKKQPRAPYSWQKRWVVVKNGHMLWSDKQREIVDASNEQERNKFNGTLSIMHIDELGPVKTRSNNKFYLIAHTDKKKNRTLEFKAVSEQDRDFWLKGIQAHIDHEKSMIQYLEQTS